MKVYRISAVTLRVRDMERSFEFYSRLPGFKLRYGGGASSTDTFITFEIGEDSKTYLNLELIADNDDFDDRNRGGFGRIIFHSENVDELYLFMKNDRIVSRAVVFETELADAPWGERFFHIREPNGYQLSFAQPIHQQG
jgi:catechol 2,3-dioxygenase-like lactoylglutathione lyase family enzyme